MSPYWVKRVYSGHLQTVQLVRDPTPERHNCRTVLLNKHEYKGPRWWSNNCMSNHHKVEHGYQRMWQLRAHSLVLGWDSQQLPCCALLGAQFCYGFIEMAKHRQNASGESVFPILIAAKDTQVGVSLKKLLSLEVAYEEQKLLGHPVPLLYGVRAEAIKSAAHPAQLLLPWGKQIPLSQLCKCSLVLSHSKGVPDKVLWKSTEQLQNIWIFF